MLSHKTLSPKSVKRLVKARHLPPSASDFPAYLRLRGWTRDTSKDSDTWAMWAPPCGTDPRSIETATVTQQIRDVLPWLESRGWKVEGGGPVCPCGCGPRWVYYMRDPVTRKRLQGWTAAVKRQLDRDPQPRDGDGP